jgi:hypothetical protein
MTEIRNSKYVWVIEYWNLRFRNTVVGCGNTEQSLIVYSSIHFVLRYWSY